MCPDTNTEPPTVEGLCVTFHRVARRFALERARTYPHLETEFVSAANFALFTGAQCYVRKGPQLWTRMRFAVWLSICVARKCQAVVAKEKTRSPTSFEVHGPNECRHVPAPGPPFDEVVADAEEQWADVETAVRLLDVLDEPRRELFLRHHADGESMGSLARERGVNTSTVAYHLKFAMAKVLAAADALKF
ncbi:sigma factor-like helix-turn-helix DNA-binding protein [Gemmata sp.]|uniref:sigma factor-like helix-turn-helix DNA-binding protein n=1 Tax=Gemmata sp. TaxID=1914242 RepID=UPI003F7006E6